MPGKSAVVSGGGSDLGLATVVELAESGAQVALFDLHESVVNTANRLPRNVIGTVVGTRSSTSLPETLLDLAS